MADLTYRFGGRRLAAMIAALVPAALMLSACQTEVTPKPRPQVAALAGPTVPAPPDATTPMAPTVPAAEAAFRFDRILGVPADKQNALAAGLAQFARERNLRLVRRTDPSAPYRVLGYLSAAGGDAGVDVTYVWDIVDAEGRRVHRFAGTEIAGTADADPWQAVTSDTLKTVAARTIEDIYSWINRLPSPAPAPAPGAPAVKPVATL